MITPFILIIMRPTNSLIEKTATISCYVKYIYVYIDSTYLVMILIEY